jgi:predicted permease
MFGVVGLLLLIACANVAMLLLCRADSRRTEVAVRRAIGAGRGRLLRQWFTESFALATAGVGGGLALAHWAVGILQTYFYSGPNKVALNQEVLRFAVGITVAMCVLFSLAPARYVSSIDELAALRSKTKGARARRTLAGRNALVVSQIALSLVLVTGATIFGRTLLNLEREPLGFDQDNVLLMRVNPRDSGYVPTNVGDLYRRLHDALSHLPGIEHVTFARYSPFSGSTSITGSTVEGYTPAPGQGVDLESVQVGPNYPETLGLTLVAGRAIGFGDRIGTERVAMVNEAFGRKFFPASSPVDHHVRLGRDEYRVVGVIRDALFHTARDAAVPFVFVPMLQQTDQSALDCELEVRTHGDAQSIAPTIRDAVLAIDSRLSPGRARTLRAQVLETFRPERVIAGFVGVLALLALLVSAVGLYGVVSHGVAQRTREIGIRISLGASRDAVVLLLLREIAAPCVMGLAIGWVGVVLLAQGVRAQLFGVAATDLSSLALAATSLLIIVILASLIPAARALRVSPTVALQAE